MKRRGQAVVLELIDRAEAILRGRHDIAHREVGIAVLREGGAAVVGIALVGGGERGEGLESLPWMFSK